MREILFRGKRIDNGEWIEGNLFIPDKPDTPTQICIGTNVVRISYEVIHETVGQYTGLTDKNGKKIFEGDIVEAYNLLGEERGTGVVHWSELFVAWHYGHNQGMYGDCIGSYEVIGNIHDDPGLLKGGK